MLKTDIIEKAKGLEAKADAFVSETKQLLLEESSRENNLLFAAGMNDAHIERVRLDQESITRKELREKNGAVAVLTANEIKTLCIRYRLRFLPSRRYAGGIDALTGRKLAEFLRKNGDPSPEHSAQSRLYVMAPADAFNLDIKKPVPPDPVLFYNHENGLYSVVHKWGNDFTVFRSILGALTSSGLMWRWFMFISLTLMAVGITVALAPIGEGGLSCIFAICSFVFIVARTVIAADNRRNDDVMFSEEAWSNTSRSKNLLFWS